MEGGYEDDDDDDDDVGVCALSAQHPSSSPLRS